MGDVDVVLWERPAVCATVEERCLCNIREERRRVGRQSRRVYSVDLPAVTQGRAVGEEEGAVGRWEPKTQLPFSLNHSFFPDRSCGLC